MNYRLTVTQFDGNGSEILQDDIFAHNSDLKHGLQRKAVETVLNEDYRESFASAKWTNESISLDSRADAYTPDSEGANAMTMMHKTAFAADHAQQLTLYRVSDEAEVTVETTTRHAVGEKHPFAIEIQEQAGGQLTVINREIIHAANQNAAKLQINGDYEAFDGKWTKLPYGGIYRSNTETGQIVVLRQLTAEEAAELDASE